MVEGLSALITAQSNPNGSLSLLLEHTDESIAFRLERVTLALTLREVDHEIVRLSISNPKTRSVVYFQSATAVSFVRELGVKLVRKFDL